MNYLNPGDSIVCVDNSNNSILTIGETYIVRYFYISSDTEFVQLESTDKKDFGNTSFFRHRFSSLKIERKEKLKKLKTL